MCEIKIDLIRFQNNNFYIEYIGYWHARRGAIEKAVSSKSNLSNG